MVSLCSCHQNKQQVTGTSIDHKDSVQLVSNTFKTSTGWGYTITVDNKLFINQPTIPSIPGYKSFATEEDALKVANLVISKIKAHQKPNIHEQDLKALGIAE